MIVKTSDFKPLTKASLAKEQNISISSLYYRPKLPLKDWHLKNVIEGTLKKHPAYGHKRLALELRINKKRILRVMKLFGIKPYRRRGRKFKKAKENCNIYPNLISELNFPESQKQIWVSDFTYLPFKGRFVYLATIMDIFDRQVMGWSLLKSHTTQLTLNALIDALEKHGRPGYLHSDQGSEYKSRDYSNFAEQLGIKLSMSAKSSPWQNGYQESFYSQFKIDLGDTNRFKTLGELVAAIYGQLYYYNHIRIHKELKMPPVIFSQRQSILTTNQVSITMWEEVYKEMGTLQRF